MGTECAERPGKLGIRGTGSPKCPVLHSLTRTSGWSREMGLQKLPCGAGHLSRMKSITTRRQGWERALGYPSARAAPNQVPLKAVVGNYPLQEHHEESREC